MIFRDQIIRLCGLLARQNMIVTFLGTAAANAFPEAFCQCTHCEQARLLGGASLRKRSAVLINDDLLIDLGPDIMAAAQMHRCSLTNVRYCLQTHPHADHLDPSHLLSRSPAYGVVGAPALNFYASAETIQRAAATFERDLADYSLLSPAAEKLLNLAVHPIEPLTPFTFGPYRVIAFPANHAPTMGALIYAVETDRKSIFYGIDTAEFFEQTWQRLLQYDLQFDLVILDHTYGLQESGNDHLSARQFEQHIQRMRQTGLLKPNGRAFATHIAHQGNPAHPELVEYARGHGYEVAYDGLILEV
jgi:phosphoribosyl 1,2-cyclic phosphodiesterase